VTENSSSGGKPSPADSKVSINIGGTKEEVKPFVKIYNNIIAYNKKGFNLCDPTTSDITVNMWNNDEYGNDLSSSYGITNRSNNIASNPLFTDTTSYDFSLQSTSPCIDAGYSGISDDPDGTVSDIGAFYYHQPPAMPTGFNGVWYNNHPKIYWTAVSEPDLKHYEVWKKKGSASWSLRITTTNTFWIDPQEYKYARPNDRLYIYYKVRSVDELDSTSAYTAQESFLCNAPQSDKEILPPPTVEIDPIPTEFMLHPAYPNPFNMSTTLKLDLPEEARFSLVIYDINGSEVWRLNNKRTNTYSAGYHTILWDGRNNFGSVVPTGVYIIVYNSPEHKLTQKVVLMK